jgi:nascent polypeptide-associated complex subunit alpha
MRRFNPRQARRMMDRMGMNTQDMPEIREVIFRTGEKELIVKNPSVTAIEIGGQKIFQVAGEGLEERETSTTEPAKPHVSEEDAQLVADQANVSLEEAKATLESTGGDLAQAILILTSKRK